MGGASSWSRRGTIGILHEAAHKPSDLVQEQPRENKKGSAQHCREQARWEALVFFPEPVSKQVEKYFVRV